MATRADGRDDPVLVARRRFARRQWARRWLAWRVLLGALLVRVLQHVDQPMQRRPIARGRCVDRLLREPVPRHVDRIDRVHRGLAIRDGIERPARGELLQPRVDRRAPLARAVVPDVLERMGLSFARDHLAQAPEEERVVRAVGGESKCWNHFLGKGFAPSCDKALLWRDGSLWIGKIPGVRPDPPRRLIEQADGPAVWVR